MNTISSLVPLSAPFLEVPKRLLYNWGLCKVCLGVEGQIVEIVWQLLDDEQVK